MRCNYCNIEIKNATKICPLCHEKLEETGGSEDLRPAYPEKIRGRHGKHSHFTLTKIYIFVAVIISVICGIVNYLTTPETLWCYVVAAFLLYGLVLIRNTILSQNSLGVKVFVQAFFILLVLWLIEAVSKTKNWALDYGLPVVLVISTVVLTILVACNIKKTCSNLVAGLLYSIVGFLPAILYAAKVSTVLWPALVCAIVSFIAALCIVIFGNKELTNEFKKKFHI